MNIAHITELKIFCCKSAFAEYAFLSANFQKLLICDSNEKNVFLP